MKRILKKVGVLGITIALLAPTLWAHDYSNHWAKEAIEAFKGYHIINGYEDGSFKPNNPVTRAEFAAILSRLFNLSSTEGAPVYTDLLGSTKWYTTAINQVNAAHLLPIEGTTFHPHQFVTREEAAYALANAYQLLPAKSKASATPFIDEAHIAPWSKASIEALLELGFIRGTPEGLFNPKGTLTRAELMTMLHNLTGHILMTPGTYSSPLKGNVIISHPNVLLKDTTIEGNLYLTQGLSHQEVILDQVTVTGTIYVNGGAPILRGDFKKVILNSGETLHLKEGTIELLQVMKEGSTIKLEKDVTLTTFNALVPYTLIDNKATQKPSTGGGASGGSSGAPSNGGGISSPNKKEDLVVTHVTVLLNNSPIALPVKDNTVVLDIPSLSRQYSASSTLDGLSFTTNLPHTTLSSNWGEMTSDTTYNFRAAEASLGMLREVSLKAGISPERVIDYIFSVDKLTLGSLLEDYDLAQQLSSSLNLHLENNYQLIRTISHPEGHTSEVVIKLHLK